ncbi:unnamed protein product [Oikopleura dioica]|uniref:Uncharacterized protein n=1 Tax=Oikopleura dioica TaxID=34765 RepID=E4X3N4_OIKDI|nr:unnamed protein product [Oikopleura dioica]
MASVSSVGTSLGLSWDQRALWNRFVRCCYHDVLAVDCSQVRRGKRRKIWRVYSHREGRRNNCCRCFHGHMDIRAYNASIELADLKLRKRKECSHILKERRSSF